MQVDDNVLLKEEGVIRGHWPMGRITKVHPSKDGLVPSLSVHAGRFILRRPIAKIILLITASGSSE